MLVDTVPAFHGDNVDGGCEARDSGDPLRQRRHLTIDFGFRFGSCRFDEAGQLKEVVK
ncbi:MAG: hypothetical protein OXI01_20905 [Albidovulum sp.]|nr:hypothetical protein [Albidovulum sp.]